MTRPSTPTKSDLHSEEDRPMSAFTVRLLATHPALSLLTAITDGISHQLAEGALCGLDPELHTGPDAFTTEPADEQAAREQVAREVCAECPVRQLCEDRAVRLHPEHGVWAGFTAREINGLADLPATFDLIEHRDTVALISCGGGR
ncbi:WhiB family transcriptional regulator [Streptosporangium canum]|uniref:WhiB family transcriptional regulator n=1 Tax=Streptosporangium canum TaxID=324952 RepID=UPI003420E8C5